MRMASPIQTDFIITSASDLADDIKLIDQTGADAAANTDYTFTFELTGGATTLDITQIDAINLDSGSSLTLVGNGDAIDGQSTQRGLFVYAGTVTVEDLTIANMRAQGGAGAAGGGGGGAGLGGGLFVASGAIVTLLDVDFSNDSAVGGKGGGSGPLGSNAGGGGGGLGGDGGARQFTGGGGGGVGAGANGGFRTQGASNYIAPGAGIIPGVAGSGGGGGLSHQLTGIGGGGGGVGGQPPGSHGSGGAGGFGGGGGGGGTSGPNDITKFGGAGGFGGGGGGGFKTGGAGGFGGGGGGANNIYTHSPGAGGFGGGNAFLQGGGGLGAGGDIFVQQGGSLTIETDTQSSSLGAGTVTGGAGGGKAFGVSAGKGSAYGDGLFIQGDQSVTFAPDALLTISGVIADMTGSHDASGQTGAGALIMNGPGILDLAATNTFTGGITIEQGTVMLSAPGAAGSGAITFAGTANPTLEFTIDDLPTNEIDNFQQNDTIRIDDFLVFGSPVYFNDTLVFVGTDLATGQGGQFELHIPGLSALDFQLAQGTDYSLITDIACYCPGTLIQTEHGEVPIERLAIGDNVLTASGVARPIKWIGRRSYAGRFLRGNRDILPICIRAGALDDAVPKRDLWVSPHHAIYLDGILIEAKDLRNGVSIVQAQSVATVDYFHIELETHDLLIAEGALAESFVDDDSRGMFHNAHEYAALYPDAAVEPPRYYAPRLEEGYQVDDARRRIALRAGLLRVADGAWIGALRGYVDFIGVRRIGGWAQNLHAPEAPVCLDIFADGKLIGQVLANSYRDDLRRAGLGSGRHGFEFAPPADVVIAPGAVEIRRSLDGVRLQRSASCEAKVASRGSATAA
jgi:hypothetical protein